MWEHGLSLQLRFLLKSENTVIQRRQLNAKKLYIRLDIFRLDLHIFRLVFVLNCNFWWIYYALHTFHLNFVLLCYKHMIGTRVTHDVNSLYTWLTFVLRMMWIHFTHDWYTCYTWCEFILHMIGIHVTHNVNSFYTWLAYVLHMMWVHYTNDVGTDIVS